MHTITVRVDVSGATDLAGRLEITASIHLPDRLPRSLPLLVGLPGGGYNRRYFDIREAPGYSQALHHTDLGFGVVATDHLGTGDSSLPDPFDLTLERVAAAGHAAHTAVVQRLREGSLSADLPAQPVGPVIGMGQSMGGGLLTVQQARHGTFDAVVLLGWSGIRGGFPRREGGHSVFEVPARGSDLRQHLDQLGGSVMADPDRVAYTFHWPEDAGPLVEADLAGYRAAGPLPSWRSPTIPPVALILLGDRVVAEEAAAIDVPVLIACGVRDIVPNPHDEPAAYPRSADVSVAVVDRMAHMHNFAATRRRLWDRIAHFACSPAVGADPAGMP